MRLSRPSPALVVACVALFVALGGTSIAAVNYARNAGKVDGKDAVSAAASFRRAAGNVVATRARGPKRGQLPGRFVSEVAHSRPVAWALAVGDNQRSGADTLVAQPRLATVTASCADSDPRAGFRNPRVMLTVYNTSAQTMSFARNVVRRAPIVGVIAPSGTRTLTFDASSIADIQLQRSDGATLRVDAAFNEVGSGTAAAACAVFGSALRMFP